MNLFHYRNKDSEQARIRDIFELMPAKGSRALDIGARDGFLSRLLAERFESVVALDLHRPDIDHPGVEPVKGDATALPYSDNSFDLVFCSEVLEHIPSPALEAACLEIVRVASGSIVIGVPYRQDLRLGETTCRQCGNPNPPWGHVNRFDERRLRTLFSNADWVRSSFAWSNSEKTNRASVALLRFAGNPYGTYDQEEPCIHCGASLKFPVRRTIVQRLATRIATVLNRAQSSLQKPQPMWIHVLFEKQNASR